MIILDSSPIIVLGKTGFLHLVRRCFHKALVPRAVYNEVMCKRESPESQVMTKAIEEKWLSLEKVTINKFFSSKRLGKGEKEVLSLALKKRIPVILDDDLARSHANGMNIEVHGTLYVILYAFSKKIINENQSLRIVDNLIQNGLYISTEIYALFLKEINITK